MTERPLTPAGGTVGTRKHFNASDIIDNRDLTQHAFVPIIEQVSTKTRHYFHGYGVDDADTAVGRLGLDLQVADDDSGTNQANAKGTARAAVYPDEQADVPKATGDEWSLAELRDLDGNALRDKELWPTMKPGADQDEMIVWEVEIDSSQEGMQVYAEGSSALIHYTERKLSQRG